MKLYRGLKRIEYGELDNKTINKNNESWKKILEIRKTGNLIYPSDLDALVKELFRTQCLTRQYFTDNKKVAKRYAKNEGGQLIEIDVPINDLLKYFILEFQNYSKRKKSFEITYLITGKNLIKKSKDWNLKIKKPQSSIAKLFP